MGRDYKKRKTRGREEAIVFLLVCEGEKTERIYFEGYKERNSGLKLHIPRCIVTDPENLVRFARNRMSKYDIDFENGDQVWCIFDADGNKNVDIQKAKTLAGNEVKLCLSNPCFELWYLLHFGYFDQRISSKDLQTRLSKYILHYDKTKDYFDLLRSKRDVAIKYAERLKGKHTGDKIEILSLESNPSTQVAFLVQEILRIMTRKRR